MDELEKFPAVLEIDVEWGDMDAFGHVNNKVYFRYFENGRMAYFERIGFADPMTRDGVRPVVSEVSTRYHRPVSYPDRLHLGIRVTSLSRSTLTMEYELFSEQRRKRVAQGAATVVAVNTESGKPVRLPSSMVDAIESLEERSF